MVDHSTNNNLDKYTHGLRGFLSINDLKEKEYKNIALTTNERLALKNFDRYRIIELNRQNNEKSFQTRYLQLQAMANLTPYEEFLKEDYYC